MSEREVLLAVLKVRDPQEWTQFLDRLCAGDAALRDRVEKLLESEQELDTHKRATATFCEESTEVVESPGDLTDRVVQSPTGPSPGRLHEVVTSADGAESRTNATNAWAADRGDPIPRAHGELDPRKPRHDSTVRTLGDFEIEKALGRGGMGVVYKARQVSLNRPVALKMIKSGTLADEVEVRRFRNEAEAIALLDHPAIVSIYDVGEIDGQHYFSMKLVEGGNLGDRLDAFRADPRGAVTLMIEVVDAVQHAHMRGILHRDLNPSNILLDVNARPHIADFGLAKLLEDDVELTSSGTIMGTPAYMSPEQAAGRRGAITFATDVYGLGAILYALLTGKAPFSGDSAADTLDAVLNREPEPPRKLNTRVPRDLELICLKCLEKDPTDRYPTAGALADDLRCWASGEPVSVRAAGAVERLARWSRRKPTLAAAYALGLLSLLFGGLGGVAVWQWSVAATARDREASAKTAAEQLYLEQKKLAAQLEDLARRHKTSRDGLIAMVNEVIEKINRDPEHTLSAAVLNEHLTAITRKSEIEFAELTLKDGDIKKAVRSSLDLLDVYGRGSLIQGTMIGD